MSAPAAISATFHDFRTVKGRKACQLIFEVSIEEANAALQALGGIPDAANPAWVAIARLDEKAVQKAPEPVKDKKRWGDLSPPQQAAIRCDEPAFWPYLQGCSKMGVDNAEDADRALKFLFAIESKRELNDRDLAQKWQQLDDAFVLQSRYGERAA
jgi:hypothetical protein